MFPENSNKYAEKDVIDVDVLSRFRDIGKSQIKSDNLN